MADATAADPSVGVWEQLHWTGGCRLVGQGHHHTSLQTPRTDAQAQSGAFSFLCSDVFHLHDVHLSSVRSVCVHSCACVGRADSALPSIGSWTVPDRSRSCKALGVRLIPVQALQRPITRVPKRLRSLLRTYRMRIRTVPCAATSSTRIEATQCLPLCWVSLLPCANQGCPSSSSFPKLLRLLQGACADKHATLRFLLYTMSCEAGRISEVLISGTSVSVSHMTIRTSALHVEAFAVRMGEGPWQELLWKTAVMDIAFTFVSNPGMTVTRMFQRRIPNTGPYASASILVDFSGFVCKVKHPSEAVKV